jgi:protein-S-isoprenylcysteine O-methyltransferase Ste14
MPFNKTNTGMLLRIVLRYSIAIALLGLLLFGAAGRADLPMLWAYLVVFYAVGIVGLLAVVRRDSSVLQERFRPAARGKDRVTRPLAAVSMISALGIAALDVGRFHWSPGIPPAIQGVALVLVAVSFGVWMWAMQVNPFFSSEVRIQRDRGQRVIMSGPYRLVGHPGYAVLVVLLLSTPVALGSLWAMVAIAPLACTIIWRTRMEDRMLLAELAGYAEYAGTVRFRLIPGLW